MFLDKLRHEPGLQTMPVIMLSGSLSDRQHALDMGASYFLSKPCDPITLISALQSVAAPTMM
jgi:CheY-like chemotaxis protein